jgi:Fe-Mn family superoxide dismutase
MTNPFTLPPLPYPQDALATVISPNTISFHYGKHHKGYVDKLNELTRGKIYSEMSLENIILETAHKDAEKSIYNNAAQVWNHTFYWNCLSPQAPRSPSGDLAQAMDSTFGSFEEFKKQWVQAAVDQFGSGWVWLCRDLENRVQLVKSSNAQNPLTMNLKPLLTIDVWEHAYYLDFQNKRADHVSEVIDHLLNWEFAERNFES